jgi:hypothetical protein
MVNQNNIRKLLTIALEFRKNHLWKKVVEKVQQLLFTPCKEHDPLKKFEKIYNLLIF